MEERTPLRILNSHSDFFGLNVWDICGLGYLFVLSHALLEKVGLGLLSFGVVASAGYGLSLVRLNHRPRIIRDTLKFYFIRRSIYDAETQKH